MANPSYEHYSDNQFSISVNSILESQELWRASFCIKSMNEVVMEKTMPIAFGTQERAERNALNIASLIIHTGIGIEKPSGFSRRDLTSAVQG